MDVLATRTAIYLRQSLNKTDEELALDRQREDCAALCQAKGWTVVKEYAEDDTSASNGKARRKYQEMLRDIRAGKIDAVVAWHQDRLHRDVMELLLFTELAVEHNLKLATVSGDLDLSTDDGEFMATIGAAVARKEVRRKSARQKRANRQMAETESRPWWPSRPFGFDADPDPTTGKWWTVRRDTAKRIVAVNTIRKHPTEAKLLKEAYRRFNAGTTVRTIAAEWNAAGVRSPRAGDKIKRRSTSGEAVEAAVDGRWTGASVRALLLAPRNAGLREYGGQLVIEQATGTPKRGTWPAIVTPAVWEAAARKLQEPGRGTNAPRVRKYLLSGLAFCGRCGATLGSAISSRGQRQYGCNKCQRIARDGKQLDTLIIETVVRRLSRPDAVELLRPPVEEADAGALREERRALQGKLVQLGKDFASAPPAFTQAALAEINGRLEEIGRKLDDPGKAAIFEGVIGVKDVRAAFLSLDLGRQRTIVNALLKITVNPVARGTGPIFNPDAIDVVWMTS